MDGLNGRFQDFLDGQDRLPVIFGLIPFRIFSKHIMLAVAPPQFGFGFLHLYL
jgi:hypothetical protein